MDSLWTLFIVNAIIWLGLASYLFFLDSKIKKLEKRIDKE